MLNIRPSAGEANALTHCTTATVVSSLVEIGQEVMEKKIFKFRQSIFAISLSSIFGKEHGPSYEQARIPITTQGRLSQVGLKLAVWF